MRTTSKQVIDGDTYEVGHWPVDKQLEILTRLFQLLGEPLVIMIFGNMGKGKDEKKKKTLSNLFDSELDMSIVSKSVSALVLKITSEEVKSLFREVTSGVRCKGKEIEFNTHFMGRIGHLFKVFMFCARHQYSDFLGEFPGGAAQSGNTTQD